jgi:hypothetical protein
VINEGTKLSVLKSLRAKLAAVAQDEYDKWDEDEDVYAGGGICHLIADRMADVLIAHHFDVGIVSAQIGEQHVWCVAKTDDGVVSVDIPPSTYERGGGYSWHKLQGVGLEPMTLCWMSSTTTRTTSSSIPKTSPRPRPLPRSCQSRD